MNREAIKLLSNKICNKMWTSKIVNKIEKFTQRHYDMYGSYAKSVQVGQAY
jgi:hypothetical protein